MVDDDEVIRELMAKVLRLERLDVDVAADGFEAVRRLETGVYDLIVSDFRMPRLDGVELYREIERRWPNMVVPDYENFLHAVQPALLHKPFEVDRLRGKVRQMLTGV